MANLFLDLPLPTLNGAGAAVDVSAMGAPKTVTVIGGFAGATVAIEGSCDGGSTFSPLTVFQNTGGERVLPVAVQFVRTSVAGRKTTVPFAADCDIGANDGGAQFATLPLPVLNGAGTAVDISAFGDLATFVATGAFGGASIAVEISENNVSWAPLVAFSSQGGVATKIVTASWARATVSGRKPGVAFSGSLSMGATDPSSGGGGSGTEQVFRYTVTGLETNPFTVTLPAARASANYNVDLELGGPLANAFKAYRPLVATFATTDFDVECGALVPEAGDILMITVKDLT